MARLMNVDGIDRLNVLVSVDRSGGCVLSAFGVFQVRATRASHHFSSHTLMQRSAGGNSDAGCPTRFARQALQATQ